MRKQENFTDFFKKEKQITDEALDEFLQMQTKEAFKLDVEAGRLVEKIKAQVLRGGKRARPMLVRLAYSLAQGDREKQIVSASIFVELIHSFLLVHDDIADRDEKRYGGATLEAFYRTAFKKKFGKENKHFGLVLALISGDHLFTVARQALLSSNFSAEKKVKVGQIMSKTLTETLAGWQIQYWQNFETIPKASERRFLRGMELVSARYSFEAPLMIGLTLAGGMDEHRKILRKYAYHTGMAFQIQDDILGVFGETEQTGKPVGNDIREGKKTLLVLRAYKNSGGRDRQFLQKMVGKDLNGKELAQVRKIIVGSGSLEYSKKMAEGHVEKAVQVLEKVRSGDREPVERLKQLAEFVIARKF